jgi:hypothetical protein
VQAVTHGRWIDQPQNMMETQMVQEAFDEIWRLLKPLIFVITILVKMVLIQNFLQ